MSRIKNTFNRLKKKNETALIPYVMAGDPDLATTKTLILEMEKAGCDIIELGAPFSDPLADGPTIQKAAIRSLTHGTSIADVLGLVSDVRTKSKIPLILMTYYNLVFHYGEEKFVNDAVAAGLDGLILPDLPPEEAGTLIPLAKKAGLDTIFLLAPTSTDERIKLICKVSQGFVYYVSLTGVTGARAGVQSSVQDSVRRIKTSNGQARCRGIRHLHAGPGCAGFALGSGRRHRGKRPRKSDRRKCRISRPYIKGYGFCKSAETGGACGTWRTIKTVAKRGTRKAGASAKRSRQAVKKKTAGKAVRTLTRGVNALRAEVTANKKMLLLQKTKQALLSGKSICAADVDTLLADYLNVILSLTGMPAGCVLLHEDNYLVCRAGIGPGARSLVGRRLPLDQGIAGWVFKTGKTHLSSDGSRRRALEQQGQRRDRFSDARAFLPHRSVPRTR